MSSRLAALLLGVVVALAAATPTRAQSGTFIDRWDADDLRVVSFNIYRDAIFDPRFGADAEAPDRFARIVNALRPDVLALQEVYEHSAAQVATLMNQVAPLGGSDTWNAYRRSDNVIVSRYPLLATTGSIGHADAVVDLPDDRYDVDLLVTNDHLPCCSAEPERQLKADRLVTWMEDLRTPGGAFTVPTGTPFVLLGDFNIVGSGRPLETLLTGDVEFDQYFDDSPPDWDGTPITDAHPLQNGRGPEDYTWRNDSDRFDPGVLDYVLFSDSVLETANRFVLNTRTMTPGELAATGLEPDDVLVNVDDGFFDHLPLAVDFRLRSTTLPGDYNRDGFVNEADYAAWDAQFGVDAAPPADGNGDGVVGAADYTVWRDSAVAAGAAVPEPHGMSLLIVAAAHAVFRWLRRLR